MKHSFIVFIFILSLFSCKTNTDLNTWLNNESYFDSQILFQMKDFQIWLFQMKELLLQHGDQVK